MRSSTQPVQGTSEEEEGSFTDSISQTPQPKEQGSPSPTRKVSDATAASGTSARDRLLAQAAALGIPVVDDRQSSGRIWIELVEASDNPHRRLVRKLLESGFAFWPGKGYWI
jgi:RNA polymerase primary sigma factor